MAAQEYFNSFQPGQPQNPQPTSRPNASPYAQPSPYQSSPYVQPPYPNTPPQGPPQPQYNRPTQTLPQGSQSSYAILQQKPPYPNAPQYGPPSSQQQLMVPVHLTRSRSEPPENRRLSVDDYDRDRRHHKHHHHHHSRHSRDRSQSRSRSRSRHSHRSHTSSHRSGEHDHKDRDTFLGAGGGAIIGDAIFPGLGTLGGALFGGFGGREYAKSRSKSDSGYKDGITVHSGFVRR